MDLADPRLDPYRALRQVRTRRPAPELFIVEGRIALERALACGWRPRSVAGTRCMLERLSHRLVPQVDRLELDASTLRELVGFDFHRGCLAAFERPANDSKPSAALLGQLCASKHATIVVAQGLADPANLGAVARTARAFGGGLLVVDAAGADPYERRAIRASMGHILGVPVVRSPDLFQTLEVLRDALGVYVLAATTRTRARPLRAARPAQHLVVLVGNEGEGLPETLCDVSDEEVMIEMAPEVDSLNVANALGVILWALRQPDT